MLKKVFKSLTILIAVLGLLFIPSKKINAEDINNDLYTDGEAYTESMDINIVAKSDYSFAVEQRIKVQMGYDEHGIYMVIPYTKESNITIDSVSGPGDYNQKYVHKNGKNFVQLKIGDPDEYLEGEQEWVVRYTIQGYKLKNKKDFVALSMVPAFWDTPIKHTKTTITMPEPVKWNNLKMYTGSDGSTTKLQNDEHFKLVKKSSTQLVVEGHDLPSKYGASMRADLPSGYWNDDLSAYPFVVLSILILLAIICGIFWFLFGRDKKPVETVEFYPPENLTPAEIGYLIDGEVDDKDLIAMIFYFANKGYVKIEPKKDGISFIIRKLKSIDDTDEPNFVKILFHGMFSGKVETFTTNIPSQRFAKACQDARISLENRHTTKNSKIYDTKSIVIRNILLCIAAFILLRFGILLYCEYRFNFVKAGLIATGALAVLQFLLVKDIIDKKTSLSKSELTTRKVLALITGVVICGCMAFIFNTPYGEIVMGIFTGLMINLIIYILVCIKRKNPNLLQIQGRILGFRHFIELAEVEKLKMLVEENPTYFFDVIPYAYIFGLSDKWAKKFEHIMIETPDWYVSDVMFNTYVFISIFDSVVDTTSSATSSAISSMSNSSSVGSTGGSSFSSSGGFGGGGGGTW